MTTINDYIEQHTDPEDTDDTTVEVSLGLLKQWAKERQCLAIIACYYTWDLPHDDFADSALGELDRVLPRDPEQMKRY